MRWPSDGRVIAIDNYRVTARRRYFVYRHTCRALFEKHKLLFSFQICAKILQATLHSIIDYPHHTAGHTSFGNDCPYRHMRIIIQSSVPSHTSFVSTLLHQGAKKMNLQEHDFFLRGGQVYDKSAQPPNPCSDWISEVITPN